MASNPVPDNGLVFRGRLKDTLCSIKSRVGEMGWVIVMFLVSELFIWAIYTALKPLGVAFLSSITGMVAVFLGMTIIGWVFPGAEGLYERHLKSKVNFINQNLGIGFPVPMVMFIDNEDIQNIGLMFGNFFSTGAVFWTVILLLSWGVMLVVLYPYRTKSRRESDPESGPTESEERAKLPTLLYTSDLTIRDSQKGWSSAGTSTLAGTPSTSAATSIAAVDVAPAPGPASTPAEEGEKPSHLRTWYASLLAASCVVIIGLPVSYAADEDRPLDLCVLWLTWVTTVRAQSTLRSVEIPRLAPEARGILATLLNPVLLTAFSMMAYTRLKALARDIPDDAVLRTFSSGIPLAELWSGTADPGAGLPAFGAGDIALSLLEAGIVVWGFKLHECRRQLFSPSGLAVVLVSVASAALSAFVSVTMSRAMGVGGRESLSFAARSTTLALSKPSTSALGGSEMVNAYLVVGNGILGQILAPWVLGRLRVRDVCDGEGEGRGEGAGGERGGGDRDSAVEVAAGAAVGMNGAAMGVSYLYERRSRAAPYAALSMTAFGVVTTLLAGVEPSQGALRRMAGL
ncbi:uncharacterized protein DNG_07273 [Cephalotrichum gorgonifer]|uniref:LrgB domain-containing protein n=1 Tax=Cephalotrichum gorgonifer TaxID=2041049 RepID=A0AAE8SXA7_9PEZI|nr:uncharacterized protein DNG_07273 [Cephalotrichum gorgonifer]